MKIAGIGVLVTGGASGLGLATARRLVTAGAKVLILDLLGSNGEAMAKDLGKDASFAAADVTVPEEVNAALDTAESMAPLRAVVHCAGRGGSVRLVEKDGEPGSLEQFRNIIDVNLVGTFIVDSLAAARMARNEPIDGECGVIIQTASVAAFEGQIGQAAYAASKAGIHGLTICAARDLASKLIRVCTIAPGIMDTPLLARLPENVKESLGTMVPHPRRLGDVDEYAALAQHVIENALLNGTTIRLDGAIRMAPR